MTARAATLTGTRAWQSSLSLDPVLLTAAGGLMLLGLVMVASASLAVSETEYGDAFYFVKRQSAFLVLGVLMCAAVTRIPIRFWQAAGFASLLGAVVLLTSVLLPGLGHSVNGSTRWLSLGIFGLQVSEPARLLILIYLCGYLVRHRDSLHTFKAFVRPLVFVVLACALMLAEPDFGAASVLLATSLCVMFAGGVRIRHFVLVFAVATLSLGAIALTSAYRVERLTAFLNPWADPYDSGFQLTQSLIAIGRGEWIGVGLGAGVQKLFYLPEAHTDFLFAVLAEELGFAGVIVTIGLFTLLVWRAFTLSRAALSASAPFHASLALALGCWLGIQGFINIGVNMGVLPTKGLTLPFLSYGGSSLLVTCIALGLMLRINHELVRGTGRRNRERTDRELRP